MQSRRVVLVVWMIVGLLCMAGDVVHGDENGAAKNIAVNVESQWFETSRLDEAVEYFGSQSEERLWSYVEALNAVEVDQSAEGAWNSEEVVDKALEAGRVLLGDTTSQAEDEGLGMRVFRAVLATRAMSPRVALHTAVYMASGAETPECSSWVTFRGRAFCDVASLLQEMSPHVHKDDDLTDRVAEYSGSPREGGDEYNKEVDHVYPSTYAHSTALYTAVLHTRAVGSPLFRKLHEALKRAARLHHVRYVLRMVDPDAHKRGRFNLQSYGVELAIKSTEYKVIDDSAVFTPEDQPTPPASLDIPPSLHWQQVGMNLTAIKTWQDKAGQDEALEELEDSLSKEEAVRKLDVWQLQDLGFQASQLVLGSADPLEALEQVSQNFPALAHTVAHVKVDTTMKEALRTYQQHYMGKGTNRVLLNGRPVEESSTVYSLLRQLEQDQRIVQGIADAGVDAKHVGRVFPRSYHMQTSARVDARGDAVRYINDLERDGMYRSWPSSVRELLAPTYQGQIKFVRKNLYTAVLVLDASMMNSLRLVNSVFRYWRNQAPVRFAFLFVGQVNKQSTSTDDVVEEVALSDISDAGNEVSDRVARLYYYLLEKLGNNAAMNFLLQLYQAGYRAGVSGRLEMTHVQQAFGGVLGTMGRLSHRGAFEGVMHDDDEAAMQMKAQTQLLREKGLYTANTMLINGMVYAGDQVDEVLVQSVFDEAARLRMFVHQGKLTDKDSVYDWLMEQPGVVPRLNKAILSVGGGGNKNDGAVLKFADLTTAEAMAVDEKLAYLSNRKGSKYHKSASVWVVTDMSRPEGVQMAKRAMKWVADEKGSSHLFRVAVLHHGTEAAHEAVQQVYAEAGVETSGSADMRAHRSFVEQVLGVPMGHSALVLNGRVMDLGKESAAQFVEGDMALLEHTETYGVSTRVYGALADLPEMERMSKRQRSQAVMRIVSVVAKDAAEKVRTELPGAVFQTRDVAYRSHANGGDSQAVRVQAIVDPLSVYAQKMSVLMRWLRDEFGASVDVAMNPVEGITDMPLKSFYRYTVDSRRTTGKGPWTVFAGVPANGVLTMNLAAPEYWLIEAERAAHDLDNIRLLDLGEAETMYATYRMKHLVVTGHCYDADVRDAPRGLELTLGKYDTIVMSNLGYFQLKSQPGVWPLELKEGRGRELYEMSRGGAESHRMEVAVQSWEGKVVRLWVNKRAGKEQEELLVDENEKKGSGSGGLFGMMRNMMGGNKKQAEEEAAEQEAKAAKNGVATRKKQADINVFSIASGHLYERFLRIMVLSVMKHTKKSVKFWFLGNYLSPQFKKLMPRMAARYGFEYELVSYQWPSWLNRQTEKMRLIWAYKVLFLDVLFPIDLDKIIFVDADQVVRADLYELIQMDLHGRVAGYTPFCNSRADIEGFRFWKSGFWKQHLQGRPYHISALYVVDLKRFRALGAGDQYRVTYESLSKDPNSLSNLDQDLPNYLQHVVPLHSLPQEWLWCESWCSEESKARAKTIDLCNNPMTKVPKLEAAVTIIPEWRELDKEARASVGLA